jgi:hypothetical protein
VIGSSPENASDRGMLATTMRIVNAIPAVCAAPPRWCRRWTCR